MSSEPEGAAPTGLVVGLEANRPTVLSDRGERFLCYLRGKIQREHGRIMVGDQVAFAPTDPGEAIITDVLPRTNVLLRPPLANVTGVFAAFTLRSPVGSRELLDKRLVLAELTGLDAEVVINKVDREDRARVEALAAVYRAAGYPVFGVSALTGEGLQPLLDRPRDGIWVMSGESGTGKSSLIQAMVPEAEAVSGELSRIGRGRETTRRVALWPVRGFWLADAPGYTQLGLKIREPERIVAAFPEFAGFSCRYGDCRHVEEPGCGVLAALSDGRIDPVRYQSFRVILKTWVEH